MHTFGIQRQVPFAMKDCISFEASDIFSTYFSFYQ